MVKDNGERNVVHIPQDVMTRYASMLKSSKERAEQRAEGLEEKLHKIGTQNLILGAELQNSNSDNTRLKQENKDYKKEVSDLTEKIDKDELTRTYSREFVINKALPRQIRRAEDPKNRNYSFLFFIMDLDHFKSVNDSLGHDSGDELLRAKAGELKDMIEKGLLAADCVLGRHYEGDEFSGIIPVTNTKDPVEVNQAYGSLESVRKQLERTRKEYSLDGKVVTLPKGVEVTATIGVCMYDPKRHSNRESLIKEVDEKYLKKAKWVRNTVSGDGLRFGYVGPQEKGLNKLKKVPLAVKYFFIGGANGVYTAIHRIR